MVIKVAEQTQTQRLENALKMDASSTEEENVSEETSDETKDTTTLKDTTALKETAETDETTESGETEDTKDESEETKPEGVTFTEEQEAEVSHRIQAESDTKVTKLNQRNESHLSQIKELQNDNTDLKRQLSQKTNDRRMSKLLPDMEEEGYSADDVKTVKDQLSVFNEKIDEYNTHSEQVEATAKYVTQIVKELDPGVVKAFNLNDPNVNVKAAGGMELIQEAVALHKDNQNFLLVLEKLFPKGGEVREKFDGIVKKLADFDGNGEAKELYLSSQEKGFNVRPKKAPSLPSQDGGGEDLSGLTPEQRMERAIRITDKKKGG